MRSRLRQKRRSSNHSITYTVTSIGTSAFSDCSSLEEIILPNSVTSIGKGAFKDCSALMQIIIPDSVTSIGDRAFLGCSSLKDKSLLRY